MLTQTRTRIRKASPSDVAPIVALVEEFFHEGLCETGLSFDRATLTQSMTNIVQNNICLIHENAGRVSGVIAGYVTPSLFDDDELLAQEIIWFMSADARRGSAGVDLLEAFEAACKDAGAKHVMMIHLADVNSRVMERFYKMRGYRMIEQHFIKEV